MSYDFVIVGGGSAGCVIARRLSEDRATSVLLLEAGRPDRPWDLPIHMPAARPSPIGSRFYDWRFESEPEPAMNGRRIRHGSGKVLGGSSAINDMLFQRGNPLDFERWAADPGMAGWDYAHCLPYFKRSESCATGADTWRGGDGPLVLERGPAAGPLFRALFEAVLQAGHQLTNDVNGYRQEGFAAFDRNISRGRRLSAAGAYLRPVTSRPNLEVRCRTVVNRVLFEGVRAVGVEITHGDTTERVDAGEVILCAGAINSPHVLQLSGIGNAGELRAVGVDVIADLPAVGANLQDHLVVRVKHSSSQPVTAGPALRWRNRPSADMNWLLFRRGPGATNHLEAGGFARSNASVAYPNLMFHFVALALREGDAAPRGHGYQLRLGPTDSDARGSVKIVSADPRTHPAVRFNHLTSEQDRREWVEAVRAARRILRQAAFESFNAGELAPGAGVDTDEELAAWVARDAESARHPASTCRMGVGADSVVHPSSMRVHGLDGIRVADASAMRYLTNGDVFAPTVMLAEKAADLILDNTPLPPIAAEFYRHRPTAVR